MGDNFLNSKIQAKVAFVPQGPWSDPVELFQATPITKGGVVYAAAPQPYFDESGKTLVVTFTNNPNVIQAIRVVGTIAGHPGVRILTTFSRRSSDYRLPELLSIYARPEYC